jgi:hypothetical protein
MFLVDSFTGYKATEFLGLPRTHAASVVAVNGDGTGVR